MSGSWNPGLSRRAWFRVAGVGAAVGVAYALSPLTVWFAVAATAIVLWAGHGLPRDERRWISMLLVAAILVRVAAVAGLFLITDHASVPFSIFFGDEAFFIRRSIWLRNLALRIPIHTADLIYTYDAVGETSYLYLLAVVQVLVGPSPYGLHLIGIAFYLAAAVLLYRLVRRTLGSMPAFAGLALMLFLPSLFAWSISALKEPAFFLLSASTITLVERAVRAGRWRERAMALVAVIALIVVVETVRRVGALILGASLLAGLAIGWAVVRPRFVLVGLALAPIVVGVIASRPQTQMAVYAAVQQAARQHVGHIYTIGYVYKTLNDRFYQSYAAVSDMRFFEAGQFLMRSIFDYLTVPLPWQVQSRSALAYLPEQVVWYCLLALLPVGLVFSFRRDAVVTGLMIAHAIVAALIVALVSGNVGTLIRHRGMAMPYIVWLSAVGGCELLVRLARSRSRDDARNYFVNTRIQST